MHNRFYDAFWTFGNHEPLTMYRRIGGKSTGGLDGSALYLEKWHRWFDSEDCVRAIKDAGANILHCRFYKGLGWEAEREDFPNVKGFAERCRAHGIRVFAYVQYSTLYSETMEEEIPDLESWAARDEHGGFVPYINESNYFRWMPCVNNPDFIAYLKKIIRIAADAKCFDGLMLDNCNVVQCRCPRCLGLFRDYLRTRFNPRDFGLKSFDHVRFPTVAAIKARTELKDPVIIAALHFWAESNRQALTALRACAKEADPALIFSGNAGSPRRGAGMREWCLRPAHFADCFDLLICQTGNEPRMIGNASVTRIREMMTCECMNLPLYPLSDGDAGGKHMEPALLLAQLMECRVWGGIPGDRFIMTPRRAEPLNVELREKRGAVNRKFFEFSKRYREYFELPDAADVGILVSWPSQELSHDSQCALFSWEELLLRNHVPFRLVFGDGSRLEGLDRCRVLVLAGQRCIGDGEVRQILDFIAQGGQVIGDSLCGDYDERYRHREANPFTGSGMISVEQLDSVQKNIDWEQIICYPANGDTVFAGIRGILENGLHIAASPEVRCRMFRKGDRLVMHFINYGGRPEPFPVVERDGTPVNVSWVSDGEGDFSSWCMTEFEG